MGTSFLFYCWIISHCTTFYWSIHKDVDIWVFFTVWLLQIKLLWTLMYGFVWRYISFLLGICLNVETLRHKETLRLTFWRSTRLFPKATVHSPRRCLRFPIWDLSTESPTSSSTFVISCPFIKKKNSFLAVLGLRGCQQAFSSCRERGLPFTEGPELLTAVASLVAEHGL